MNEGLLSLRYSRWDPQAPHPWELVRNAGSQAPAQTYRVRTCTSAWHPRKSVGLLKSLYLQLAGGFITWWFQV